MKKILIVDDEKMMLNLTTRVLQKNYQTVCASSGEEAIRLFEQENPDMVLSDLRMPEMSGYDLQNTIQSMSDTKIPFIFMTADDSDESESRGFAQGAEDYVRKPIKWELLLKRLERISDNIDEARRLKHAAETDAMTGLWNKETARKYIAECIEKKSGMLLMIDLDSFKLVNDIYGHEMGDRILVRFSELLKSTLRQIDIAGRFGGDEFIAYLVNLKSEEVIKQKTEVLNAALLKSAKEYMGEEMDIPLGVSVGAVSAPEFGTDFETLYAKADEALYQVKQAGKHGANIYCESDDDDAGATDGDDLLRRMQMIFGERGVPSGASVVDRDQFTTLYRFLTRFAGNYPWEIRLVAVTFGENSEVLPPTETAGTAESGAADRFIELAKANLRVSDVILKYNATTVILLLMKVDDESLSVPVERLWGLWEKEGLPGTRLSYISQKV